MLLPARFTVADKPRDLVDFYAPAPRPLGLEPEAKLLDRDTGRFVYVEVKRQGKDGNAEERAYKHHTGPFIRKLRHRTGLDYHSYVTVFCDELATRRRYTLKIPDHIEAGHFLLWAGYDPMLLAEFLDMLRDTYLDPGRTCLERCVDRVPLLAARPPRLHSDPADTATACQAALF